MSVPDFGTISEAQTRDHVTFIPLSLEGRNRERDGSTFSKIQAYVTLCEYDIWCDFVLIIFSVESLTNHCPSRSKHRGFAVTLAQLPKLMVMYTFVYHEC